MVSTVPPRQDHRLSRCPGGARARGWVMGSSRTSSFPGQDTCRHRSRGFGPDPRRSAKTACQAACHGTGLSRPLDGRFPARPTLPRWTAVPAESRPPAPGRPAVRGLLVADFSRVLAGPYATMLLADLGADVIKVEGPAGDDTRHLAAARSRRTASPPTTWRSTATSARSRSTSRDEADAGAGPGAGPPAPTSSSRTSSPAAWPGSAWTTTPVARRATRGVIYASISGFGSGRGRVAARLRPAGAGACPG